MITVKNIKIKAMMNNFETCMNFVENALESVDVTQKTLFSLLTVCEEVIVNIINYAYPVEVGEMEIVFEAGENVICLTFVDEGVPFNPLEKSVVNTDLEVHERAIGGLGIHMIKNMTDRVDYDFKDGKNILIIEKRI